MTFVSWITSPVGQEIIRGVQETVPRVFKAWQAQSAPRPVTEGDVARAASETAEPTFDNTPTLRHP